MLYRFRDKARYWSKIVIFSYNLHSTLPLGGFTSEFAIKFGMEKTRMVWLPDGKTRSSAVAERPRDVSCH